MNRIATTLDKLEKYATFFLSDTSNTMWVKEDPELYPNTAWESGDCKAVGFPPDQVVYIDEFLNPFEED